MPTDLFRFADGRWRTNLDLIYPPFRARVFTALAAARARGADYFVTRGFASWAEQHQLRMNYLSGKGGKAAPAGLSAHNYGLAFDFVQDADRSVPGLQLTPAMWKAPAFAVLGQEAQRVGLVWGASFNDMPHVQWPGFVNGKELSMLGVIWRASIGDAVARLAAVWSYLDSHQPKE